MVGIMLGTTAPKDVYVGGSKVSAVYAGTTKVRPLIKKIEYLLVGGGGSGGGWCGGGGGAGGVLYNLDYTITSGTYPVVIGAGGAATISRAQDGDRDNYNRGKNGGNTTFLGLTAYGGGGGGGKGAGGNQGKGQDGGSGGGASGWYSNTIGYGTAGQGYNGGACYNASSQAGQGGGGGAGAVGTSSTSSKSGNGGDGIVNPIVGSTAGVLISGQYWIAGGGGGASMWGYSNRQGSGGKGGGGDGAVYNQNNSSSSNGSGATTYGGGGGGAAGRDGYYLYSGAGYQGIVVVRYLTGSLIATGGTVTTYGNYTIHTFTSNGNFIVS